MRKQYYPFLQAEVIYRLVLLPLLFYMGLYPTRAQEGTQGNIAISNTFQMTFFGQHNFLSGGTGTQSGIINTNRYTPTASLNYGPSATYIGANDANHVNGYVLKIGSSDFTFPIGNGSILKPLSISSIVSSSSFSAAYWSVDPSNASLPSGAPFVSSKKEETVQSISDKEYWDLNGSVATKISLTYTDNSSISSLVSNDLSKLVVVGYHVGRDQWESLGGTIVGDVTIGQVIAISSIVPNDYAAFTFGALAEEEVGTPPDLRPFIVMSNTSFTSAIAERPFRVTIRNIKTDETTNTIGEVTFRIYKPTPNSTITLNEASAAIWSVESTETYFLLKSNVKLEALGETHIDGQLGIPISTGTGNFNFRAFIPTNSGGELSVDNQNNNVEVRIAKNS